MANVVMRDEK